MQAFGAVIANLIAEKLKPKNLKMFTFWVVWAIIYGMDKAILRALELFEEIMSNPHS